MRLFASILVLLSVTTPCAAQSTKPPKRMAAMQSTGFPNYCGGSLEFIVSQSPDVIRGTVLSVDNDDLNVHIRETIKGSLTPNTTLNVAAGGWPFVVGQDVVLSLVDVKGARKAARSGFRNHPVILDGKRPYYTMDLTPHTDPKDVLATVRELAAHPMDPNLEQISLYSGGRILVVPAHPRLETFAQQWAAEKTMYRRLLATQALQPFKSERNIAIVTALLDDTRSKEVSGSGKWQAGKYDVRHAASKLLADWNVPTARLPMSGPIFSYRQVNPPRIGYFIAIGIFLLFLIAWSYYRRSAMVLRLCSCIVMVTLIAALLTLWFRSRSRVDEIMFAAGNSHHEVASYGGGIHYQVMHDWNGPRQLVFGSFDREISDDVWSIDNQSPAKRRSTMGFCYASGVGAGPDDSTHPFGLFRIPFWALLMLGLIPLTLNAFVLARQIRRRRLGLCRHCGYDLRETPGAVCPECGNEIPGKRPAASAPLEAGNEIPIGGQPVGM